MTSSMTSRVPDDVTNDVTSPGVTSRSGSAGPVPRNPKGTPGVPVGPSGGTKWVTDDVTDDVTGDPAKSGPGRSREPPKGNPPVPDGPSDRSKPVPDDVTCDVTSDPAKTGPELSWGTPKGNPGVPEGPSDRTPWVPRDVTSTSLVTSLTKVGSAPPAASTWKVGAGPCVAEVPGGTRSPPRMRDPRARPWWAVATAAEETAEASPAPPEAAS